MPTIEEKRGAKITFNALVRATTDAEGAELSREDLKKGWFLAEVRTEGKDKQWRYIPGFWLGFRDFLESRVLREGTTCVSSNLREALHHDEEGLTKDLVDRVLQGGICGASRRLPDLPQPIVDEPLPPFEWDGTAPIVAPAVVAPPAVAPTVTPAQPKDPETPGLPAPPAGAAGQGKQKVVLAGAQAAGAGNPQQGNGGGNGTVSQRFVPMMIRASEVVVQKGQAAQPAEDLLLAGPAATAIYRLTRHLSDKYIREQNSYYFSNAAANDLFDLLTDLDHGTEWMGSETVFSRQVGGSLQEGYKIHVFRLKTTLRIIGKTVTVQVIVKYTWKKKANGGWEIRWRKIPWDGYEGYRVDNNPEVKDILDETGGWDIDPIDPSGPSKGSWVHYNLWFDPDFDHNDALWDGIKKNIEEDVPSKVGDLFNTSARVLKRRGKVPQAWSYSMRRF